jgi:hypothetical protein
MAPKKKTASKKSSKTKTTKASAAKPKANVTAHAKAKVKTKSTAEPKATKPAKKNSKKLARKPRPAAELNEAEPMVKGRGARTGGQSGDDMGLSDVEDVDSESVEELVDEGQDFEAELVSAVENAPDPDEAELDAEVPEDDPDPDVRSFSKRNRL